MPTTGTTTTPVAPPPGDEEQPLLTQGWGPRAGRVVIDISGRSVARIVLGLLALAFIANIAGQMRDVLVWIFAAAFLAIALNPLVVRLEPRLGRRTAATVVFVGFVIGFL